MSTPSPDLLGSPRCAATKPDGSPCQARRRTGSAFCYFHDPAVASDRQAARQRGGRERTRTVAVLSPATPDLPMKTVADVVAVLGDSLNRVRRGELDPKIANCVGFLSGLLLKAIEQGDIEARLSALESAVSTQPPASFLSTDTDYIFTNDPA